ncbi:hypothetical protein D0C36_08855 [Mucilaginibacter conchicola]|uniref:Uncharacterized protein n=2 Tax=Mucilaginibacter conchicola TaxID=2303333 RepID=A0A372NZP7_9SPHI|nr:hypothetical protein D0C36_08855 [Mucilaginibacter conchicola]
MIALIFTTKGFGGTGCLYNNRIYLIRNTVPSTNPINGNWLYQSGSSIRLRTYDQENLGCGVRDNKYKFASPYQACDIIGVATYAAVITWLDSDNSCPLDSYSAILLIVFGCVGMYIIRKRFIFSI